MKNKVFYKSLVGVKAIDTEMNRIGIIHRIAFNNKDWKICWFYFKWEKGEYLRELSQLSIIKSQQLTLEI